MVIGVAEGHVDHRQPLEVVADSQLVGHAHAAKPSVEATAGRRVSGQGLCRFMRRSHLHHAMPQGLEFGQRLAECRHRRRRSVAGPACRRIRCAHLAAGRPWDRASSARPAHPARPGRARALRDRRGHPPCVRARSSGRRAGASHTASLRPLRRKRPLTATAPSAVRASEKRASCSAKAKASFSPPCAICGSSSSRCAALPASSIRPAPTTTVDRHGASTSAAPISLATRHWSATLPPSPPQVSGKASASQPISANPDQQRCACATATTARSAARPHWRTPRRRCSAAWRSSPGPPSSRGHDGADQPRRARLRCQPTIVFLSRCWCSRAACGHSGRKWSRRKHEPRPGRRGWHR